VGGHQEGNVGYNETVLKINVSSLAHTMVTYSLELPPKFLYLWSVIYIEVSNGILASWGHVQFS
jgi:hypothetical protein